MNTYVALLRGINVAGKNMLSMKELAPHFLAIGCCDIATYIQSGNIVFRADPERVGQLAMIMSGRIREHFGLSVPVVLRNREEMAAVLANNPFLTMGEEDFLSVTFLADEPTLEQVQSLDPDRSPPDAFKVTGREIYLSTPNGLGKTKLTTAYFDSKLKTISTSRNWRTVQKLYEMMTSV